MRISLLSGAVFVIIISLTVTEMGMSFLQKLKMSPTSVLCVTSTNFRN